MAKDEHVRGTKRHTHKNLQLKAMAGLCNKLKSKLLPLLGFSSTLPEDQILGSPSPPPKDQMESSVRIPLDVNFISELFYEAVSHYRSIELQVNRGDACWSCLNQEQQWKLGEAVRLWEKTASYGLKEAMFNLGLMHWHGRGVEKSNPCAYARFNDASKKSQDCTEAKNNLGYIKEHVMHNDYGAMLWYMRAAFRGVPEADHNLFVMYQQACQQGGALSVDCPTIESANEGYRGSILSLDLMNKFAEAASKKTVKKIAEATAPTKFIDRILKTTKFGADRRTPVAAPKVNQTKFIRFGTNAGNDSADTSTGCEQRKHLFASN